MLLKGCFRVYYCSQAIFLTSLSPYFITSKSISTMPCLWFSCVSPIAVSMFFSSCTSCCNESDVVKLAKQFKYLSDTTPMGSVHCGCVKVISENTVFSLSMASSICCSCSVFEPSDIVVFILGFCKGQYRVLKVLLYS